MSQQDRTPPPSPEVLDRVARLIASAIWRPQPDMSGDIWNRLGPLRRRAAEDAALSAIEEMRRYAL
jgi:hypothetical protein